MPSVVSGSSKKKQQMPTKLRLKLACDCENILKRVKLCPQSKKFRYHLLHSKDINESTYSRLMALFASLMKEAYEQSSWGWNEVEKLAEWKHSKTRLMIVTQSELETPLDILTNELPAEDESIVGFMCFRFESGADKNEAALYVYELHVDVAHQRQGLGEDLMRMARVIATDFKMDKVMLTVFRSNEAATNFYSKLKFNTDASSPAKNEADYMILSSKLKY